MNPALLVRGGFGLLLFLGIFTVVASLSFLFAHGIAQEYDYPVYQWWLFALFYPADAADASLVRSWLLQAGLFGAAIAGGTFLLAWYQSRKFRAWSLLRRPLWSNRSAGFGQEQDVPEPIVAPSGNHGTARFATEAELLRRFSGPVPPHGGYVVGELYDPRQVKGPFNPRDPTTWGPGGNSPLLIDPLNDGSPHALMFSGTGGYKTSCLVPTGCVWTGGAVFHDPKGELLTLLYEPRRRMGHSVHVISTEPVFERDDGPAIITTGTNVLDGIDIRSSSAEADVIAQVEAVCGSVSKFSSESAKFFNGQAKAVIQAVLANLMWNPHCDPELKTLETLRALLAVPPKVLLKELETIATKSKSPLAMNLAAGFSGTDAPPEDTWGSVMRTIDELTRWLATESNARAVSQGTLRARDITDGNTDVFISLPPKVLIGAPQLARCLMAALANALIEAGPKVNGKIMLMIDEAYRLGYSAPLKLLRDYGRDSKVGMLMAYQSVQQITDQWGATGVSEWYATTRWRSYAAITDPTTQEALSKECGSYGALAWSESTRGWGGRRPKGGGSNITYSAIPRRRIPPDEIGRLRTDCQLLVGAAGEYPAILGRAIGWRIPSIVAQIGTTRRS